MIGERLKARGCGEREGAADESVELRPFEEEGVVALWAPDRGALDVRAVGAEEFGESSRLGRREELVAVDVDDERGGADGPDGRRAAAGQGDEEIVVIHRVEEQLVAARRETVVQFFAVMLEITLDEIAAAARQRRQMAVLRGVESRFGAVGEHRELARELETAADVVRITRIESEDFAGDVIPADDPRARLGGSGDGQDAFEAARRDGGECEDDEAAERTTGGELDATDAEVVERGEDGAGEIAGGQSDVAAVGKTRSARRAAAVERAEMIETDESTSRGIERAARTDERFPPAFLTAGAGAAGERVDEQDGGNIFRGTLRRVARRAAPPTMQTMVADDSTALEREVGQRESEVNRLAGGVYFERGHRWNGYSLKRRAIGFRK